MDDTVTDTMTVDLTKKNINNIVINDNTVQYVRKRVGVHDRKTDTKKILLGKKDRLDVEIGDYVYIVTENEFMRLINNEVCEEKSWWKRIIQR